MRTCAICERTLLMGERGPLLAGGGRRARRRVPALPGDRARARLDQGGDADDADHPRRPPPSPRAASATPRPPSRRRGDTLAPPEPILRRLSGDEISLLEAADLFNASTYRRTVGGIAKSLGAAKASIVPLSGVTGEQAVTVAWDLSWYQYRVTPESAQPVRLEPAATSSTSSSRPSRSGTRTSRTTAGSSPRSPPLAAPPGCPRIRAG